MTERFKQKCGQASLLRATSSMMEMERMDDAESTFHRLRAFEKLRQGSIAVIWSLNARCSGSWWCQMVKSWSLQMSIFDIFVLRLMSWRGTLRSSHRCRTYELSIEAIRWCWEMSPGNLDFPLEFCEDMPVRTNEFLWDSCPIWVGFEMTGCFNACCTQLRLTKWAVMKAPWIFNLTSRFLVCQHC